MQSGAYTHLGDDVGLNQATDFLEHASRSPTGYFSLPGGGRSMSVSCTERNAHLFDQNVESPPMSREFNIDVEQPNDFSPTLRGRAQNNRGLGAMSLGGVAMVAGVILAVAVSSLTGVGVGIVGLGLLVFFAGVLRNQHAAIEQDEQPPVSQRNV